MLYELTWTYWASISAARAPFGLFGPNSFRFVAPFWVEFYFGPNIGMRGVQSVPMERPAHTALLQSIWNHPAEEIGQNVNLGSWGGRGGLILLSAFAFATFCCSHNLCAGELPRSASSHFCIPNCDSQLQKLTVVNFQTFNFQSFRNVRARVLVNSASHPRYLYLPYFQLSDCL